MRINSPRIVRALRVSAELDFSVEMRYPHGMPRPEDLIQKRLSWVGHSRLLFFWLDSCTLSTDGQVIATLTRPTPVSWPQINALGYEFQFKGISFWKLVPKYTWDMISIPSGLILMTASVKGLRFKPEWELNASSGNRYGFHFTSWDRTGAVAESAMTHEILMKFSIMMNRGTITIQSNPPKEDILPLMLCAWCLCLEVPRS